MINFTWVVCVYDSKDGLQGGAVAIQSLKQTLVNVLQEEKCWKVSERSPDGGLRFTCKQYVSASYSRSYIKWETVYTTSLRPCWLPWWRARWTTRGSRSCCRWSWRWPAESAASSRAGRGASHSPPRRPSRSETQDLTEVDILPAVWFLLFASIPSSHSPISSMNDTRNQLPERPNEKNPNNKPAGKYYQPISAYIYSIIW